MPQGQNSRFSSVDLMRGSVVAFMIVANNPGDTYFLYSELIHTHWHGWSAVDFIFPLFLFLVGVSIALAFPRDRPTDQRKLWIRAWKRAGWLFFFGLVVNGFPCFNLQTLRIPGVLQRIAVVYLATLWLHLKLSRRQALGTALFILIGYWLLWAFVPVPGLGWPSMDLENNLESWLDQMLMRGHIWEYDTTWDPEGILSTLPCISLALFGSHLGESLKSPDFCYGRTFLFGLLMFLSGLVWNNWFPINKNISTSSFILFVGGFGIMLLSSLHVLVDSRAPRGWMFPFEALGKHALSVYVISQLTAELLFFTRPGFAGDPELSLHFWLFEHLFGFLTDRYFASMAWGVLLTLFFAAACTLREWSRGKTHFRT